MLSFCYILLMPQFSEKNWKQKIDPAFDKFVRVYVDSLEQFERNPMEGKFSFPPDFIEAIFKNPAGRDLTIEI